MSLILPRFLGGRSWNRSPKWLMTTAGWLWRCKEDSQSEWKRNKNSVSCYSSFLLSVTALVQSTDLIDLNGSRGERDRDPSTPFSLSVLNLIAHPLNPFCSASVCQSVLFWAQWGIQRHCIAIYVTRINSLLYYEPVLVAFPGIRIGTVRCHPPSSVQFHPLNRVWLRQLLLLLLHSTLSDSGPLVSIRWLWNPFSFLRSRCCCCSNLRLLCQDGR